MTKTQKPEAAPVNDEVATIIEHVTTTPAPDIDDPFAPEKLRLSQSFNEMAGVRKLLVTIPVRKPGQQDFVRVRPGAEWRENFPMICLADDREQFVVPAKLLPELFSEVINVTLFLAQNKQGVIFFWPVRLPGPDGKDMNWWRSGREAAERAQTSWVRVRSNMSLGAYEIFEAASTMSEPEWPADLGYFDLIKIAFKENLINDLDHPVVKRLRGLI